MKQQKNQDLYDLVEFVRTNNLKSVYELLLKGVDPNGNKDDLIPLFEARSAKMVRLLIQEGADVNVKGGDITGTPLMKAVIRSPRDFTPDSEQLSSEAAFKQEQLGVVKELLKAGAKINEQIELNGHTALSYAALLGHSKIVDVLLERGAEDALDLAVASAARNNYADIVDKLLTKKQDIVGFRHPLLFAAFLGHQKMMDVVLESGTNLKNVLGPALVLAAGRGDNVSVQKLLDAGANIEAEFVHQLEWPSAGFNLGGGVGLEEVICKSPLYVAVQNGHPETIDLLLASGANPNGATREGWTPLMAAAQKNDVQTMKKLIEAKADVNAKTTTGLTALALAAEAGATKAITMLLPKVGDITVSGRKKTDDDSSAYKLSRSGSADEEHQDAVRISFPSVETQHAMRAVRAPSQKPDINAADQNGLTPLMLAVREGHTDAVMTLIAAGANVNATDKNGETGLIKACQSCPNNNSMVMALVHAKSDINKKDNNGLMALDYLKQAYPKNRSLEVALKTLGAKQTNAVLRYLKRFKKSARR